MSDARLPEVAARSDVIELIRRALAEDIGPGDSTSLALVPPGAVARARVVSRGRYVVAGGPVAREVFHQADARIRVSAAAADGDEVAPGAAVIEIEGPARAVLAAERTALNFLQRLTGIATLTRRYVERIAGTGVLLLDTRKTCPGLRTLEKYAVRCGGGANHRFGLYDRILIKDNHRALWATGPGASLAAAVQAARDAFPDLEVEVEVDSIEELRDALGGGPDWVLLDNMTPARLRECVALARGRARIEASGGVTLDTIAEVAATGVDAVSVGALTHSAPAADLSLEFA